MKYGKFSILCAGAFITLNLLTARAQTIMPLGDSVTSDGSDPESSYRYWLYQQLVTKGKFDPGSFNFVGTQNGVADGSPANSDFDQTHEGHPGWTTADAVFNLNHYVGFAPDIVLIDLGENDVSLIDDGLMTADDTEVNLETIIEAFRNENPNVTILLAEPTSFPGENRRTAEQVNNAIRRAAKTENQKDSPVKIVNLYGGFSARTDVKDQAGHPDVKGEQKIAHKFYGPLKSAMQRLRR
jgi:lysophospholipase L1-like esterase